MHAANHDSDELSLDHPAQLTHEHLNESNCFKLLDFEAACYTTFYGTEKSSFALLVYPKVLMMWNFTTLAFWEKL